ncbi:epoxyqueuosine reductase QueH [Clostridium beijerinckii]|jgi:Uncharacterized protein conserved in bacteria|uniref:Epoxyqueuosine reductase QueH n=2 Tax=Clostridium beijerinckii TaxID=1520 RepID=A0AAE2V3V5_CLOBE|nr:epoxyqueuosine reductase QueH [Clostridium beijerinckii]ABR33469.1 protein of unknown function DUF208 [Clostridium beijerinckii NCIMB 8052]AIU03265.1 hypothetical protein Cbs_1289 [Clostridium beijerinckii ATCC 35702]MBF7811631.1 epoxyqueuosine reductase QueH [Clostridium beijerinckii]MCI1477564.1 epoxyqueuosine reductase QueH [Clostridium beijerinckii]MCI1577342.1 epoxyqueuosine reductase QueH [Clostridium beijerinckii]
MNKINYQKELDSLIENLVKNEEVPTLLLHSCCAPCSSYVLEYLSQYFKITIFFYNPNIYPMEEYTRRVAEQKGLISEMKVKNEIRFIEGKYDTESFYKLTKGLEEEKEGGVRCFNCYELRLNEAAIMAKEKGYDYFTTTLSISPHKNSAKLNEIGKSLSEEHDVKYLYSDFKKKEGYKRSIELSKQYKLYRQDYCGCVFSKNERMNDGNEKNK